MMKNFQSVNKRIPRLESEKKALGEILYTDDIHMQGEVYAKLVRSPYSRARVLSYDLSEAEKVPGYLGCLTPEDIPKKRYNCSGNPPSPLLIKDEVLLTLEPKNYGDRILCIAAKTREACEEAVSRVKVEYEQEKPYMTVKEALSDKADSLQPEIVKGNISIHREVVKGSREDGERESEILLKQHFSTQQMQHAQIELTSCLCDFSDGKHLTIYSCSQTVYQERRIIAELVGIPETDLRMIKPAVGAGFGARQQLHAQPVCALMSKKIGRPVRLTYERDEDLTSSCVRHASEIDIELGADKEGNIKYFYTHFYLPTGPYTTHGPTVMMASSRKFQYNTPNYIFIGDSVYTDNVSGGAFRGYGNTQLTFGREIMMERMADALGMDPVEFRLKNHVQTGEYFPCASLPVSSCAIKDCVEKARAFQRELDEKDGPLLDNDDVKQAWGYAFACHGSGASNLDGMSSAIIMMNDDGTVQLMVGSADIGQGSETMETQICAESLQIPMEDVKIRAADTGLTPYDSGTFGSSQTFVCGNAIVAAAKDFNAKVLAQLAVVFPDGPVERLPDGRFEVTDNGARRVMTLHEAAPRMMFHPHGAVIIGTGYYKAVACPNPFTVCFVKAEYWKKLNAIRILDIIQTVDVGMPINRLTVEGQIQGGIEQGLGYALYEEVEVNPRTRNILSTDFLHYRFAEMDDMPEIRIGIADSFDPMGPHGAKSVGELSTIPSGPAIVNAVSHACGREISQIPLCTQFTILPSRRGGEPQ